MAQSVSSNEKKTISDNPLVSIITPVLNGIKYLEACIQSVLNQTYPHIEHIFVDAVSTDGTLEMLSSYQTRYPDRIRFISESDNGVGEAWNKGWRMARGQIFGWLDSDDLYEPDAIMTIVEFFKSHPDAYFVFGECNIINVAGEVIGKLPIKDFDLKEAVIRKCYMHPSAVFHRREVMERVGLLNTLGNDNDFYIRAGKVFQIHRIKKALSNSRRHNYNITASKGARERRMRKARWREDYILCRQHGGSIFAPRCRRYYMGLIVDGLGLYHFVFPILVTAVKLRHYAYIDKVLRIMGW